MTPGANDLCVFAVKRGNTKKRFDVDYCLHGKLIKLNSTYTIVKFGELIEDIYRYPTFYNIKYVSNGIGVIKGENIARSGEWVKINDLGFIDKETNNRFLRTVLQKNDLVMTVRGEVGKTGLVSEQLAGCNISGNVIKIRLKRYWNDVEIAPNYVWEYLNSTLGKALIKKQVSGGVQETITVTDISDIDIILPETLLQEELARDIGQKRVQINKKLNHANELLSTDMSRMVNTLLNIGEESDYKPSIYATTLRDAENSRIDPEYHNPLYMRRIKDIKRMHYKTLGDVIELSTETWNQADYFDQEFPYIEIGNVKLKENDYSVTKVSVVSAPSRARMVVRNGDIIVSTTRPHRGAVATITCKDDEIQIASTGFCVLRTLKCTDVLKEYLQWILLHDYVLLQMLQRSSGGNYPAITAEELKKIVIPIPEIEIQRQICNEANQRKETANKLRQVAEQEWTEAKAQFERELLGES